VQRPGAAHAAHDLVEDQENPVPVAYAAHRLEIARHRRHCAHGGADGRLGYKGDDVLTAELLDLCLELAREPLAIGFWRLIGRSPAILVDWRDVVGLDQQRCECPALPFASADCEGAGSDAVIALAPRDQIAALRLAALDEILPRQLERGLDRLR